jgi:hypothetical protein
MRWARLPPPFPEPLGGEVFDLFLFLLPVLLRRMRKFPPPGHWLGQGESRREVADLPLPLRGMVKGGNSLARLEMVREVPYSEDQSGWEEEVSLPPPL